MMSFKRLVCKVRGHSVESVESASGWSSPNSRRPCSRCGCLLMREVVKTFKMIDGTEWHKVKWIEVTRERLVAEELMRDESMKGAVAGNQGWQGQGQGPTGFQGAIGSQGYQGFQGTTVGVQGASGIGSISGPASGVVTITAHGGGGGGGSSVNSRQALVNAAIEATQAGMLTVNEMRQAVGKSP